MTTQAPPKVFSKTQMSQKSAHPSGVSKPRNKQTKKTNLKNKQIKSHTQFDYENQKIDQVCSNILEGNFKIDSKISLDFSKIVPNFVNRNRQFEAEFLLDLGGSGKNLKHFLDFSMNGPK